MDQGLPNTYINTYIHICYRKKKKKKKIHKRDRERRTLWGDFLLGCGDLSSDFDESNVFQS